MSDQNEDAIATVTDFLDFTEYLPADITRSLKLIESLETQCKKASDSLHVLTQRYWALPSAQSPGPPHLAHLRSEIAKKLQAVSFTRAAAYAEAARLHDVVDHHEHRIKTVLDKLESQPLPPSRDPTPPPRTVPPIVSLKLGGLSSDQLRSRSRSLKPRQANLIVHTDRSAGVQLYDVDTPQRDQPGKPGRKRKYKLSSERPEKERPPRHRKSEDASGQPILSSSVALSLLKPPPQNPTIGSEDAPWLQLSQWELALLRKRMKKNSVWQPSASMINRELRVLGRGRDAMHGRISIIRSSSPPTDEYQMHSDHGADATPVMTDPVSPDQAGNQDRLSEMAELMIDDQMDTTDPPVPDLTSVSPNIEIDEANAMPSILQEEDVEKCTDHEVVATEPDESSKKTPQKFSRRSKGKCFSVMKRTRLEVVIHQRPITPEPLDEEPQLVQEKEASVESTSHAEPADAEPAEVDEPLQAEEVPASVNGRTLRGQFSKGHNLAPRSLRQSARFASIPKDQVSDQSDANQTPRSPDPQPAESPTHAERGSPIKDDEPVIEEEPEVALSGSPKPTRSAKKVSLRGRGRGKGKGKATPSTTQVPITEIPTPASWRGKKKLETPLKRNNTRAAANVDAVNIVTTSRRAPSTPMTPPPASSGDLRQDLTRFQTATSSRPRRGQTADIMPASPGAPITAPEKEVKGRKIAQPGRRTRQASAQKAQDIEVLSGGEPVESDEPVYCYCQRVSFGEMLGCDNDDCPKEWFHLQCLGLEEKPKVKRWFCDECRVSAAKERESTPAQKRRRLR